MKIVVLDGYTLNPGDLTWNGLSTLGELSVYDRTPPELVLERCDRASAVLTNKVALDSGILSSMPQLKYIGVTATGYNVVDIEAATDQGIVVTNVPAYSTRSVAQFVLALLLELSHHVGDHSRAVRSGRWTESPDFTFRDYPLVELVGLKMGIVGYGNIGQAVAGLSEALGMEVLIHTRRPDPKHYPKVLFEDLDTIFRDCDVVTLHCPLTSETEGMVNAQRLGSMKESAFVINTSRGPIVDETALAEALNSDRIAGAAVDVLSTEPPSVSNPLLTAKNCIITPHIAWATRAARQRLMDTVTGNVKSWTEGQPVNVVTE